MKKHFIFEIKEVDGKLSFRSEGKGFHIYEALGFLEWKRDDILRQLRGEIEPDSIQRTIIEDK